MVTQREPWQKLARLPRNKMTMQLRFWPRPAALFGLALVSSLVGCGIGSARGTRLYSGAELPRDQVARLVGPVTRVDGSEVPNGDGAFELLPGCHIVEIGGRIGSVSNSPVSGWAATLPRLFYPFRMRAGHSYSIDFQPQPSLGLGPVGWGQLRAVEQDRSGASRIVEPARSLEDVEACQRWRPASPG